MSFILILSSLVKDSIAPVSIHQLALRQIVTSKGIVRGVLVEFPRETALRTVEGYFGVPFASGSYRFLPPTEVIVLSTSIRNANESVSCPQIKWQERLFEEKNKPKGTEIHFWRIMQSTKRQHESCLFLNIFVPSVGTYKSCIFFYVYAYYTVFCDITVIYIIVEPEPTLVLKGFIYFFMFCFLFCVYVCIAFHFFLSEPYSMIFLSIPLKFSIFFIIIFTFLLKQRLCSSCWGICLSLSVNLLSN